VDTSTGEVSYLGEVTLDLGSGPRSLAGSQIDGLTLLLSNDRKLMTTITVDGTHRLLYLDIATGVATPVAGPIDSLLYEDETPTGALVAGMAGLTCVTGSPGNDVLVGTNDPDCLEGLEGNDHLTGRQDNDLLDGGPDDDDLNGNAGDDVLLGGGGDDRLDGNNGADFLDGGPGADILKAGNDDDILAGGPDDDSLDGGNGFDCGVFDGDLADFEFDAAKNGDRLVTDTVGVGGTDTLRRIECYEFDDQTVVPGPNDAPIDILLSNDVVEDADPVGTLVGDFSVIDPDLVDGHVLTLVSGAGATDNGSFTIVGDTLFTAFVADFATQNTYSIRVQAEDLDGETFEKVFIITVNPPNDPPVAEDDDFTTDEDTGLGGDVLADNGNGPDSDADGDPLTVTLVNGSAANVGVQIALASGALVTVQPTGLFSYDPNGQFESLNVGDSFVDAFTYTIDDGFPATDTATVTITVTGVDDAPAAQDDLATLTEDDPATAIPVLANDIDPDGGTILIASVTQPANGAVVITGGLPGTGLTYEPSPGFCNDGVPTDDFTYTLTPGGSVATVRVTVTCVDDPPVAVDDTKTVDEDDPATTITVLGNDTDLDGGTAPCSSRAAAAASATSPTSTTATTASPPTTSPTRSRRAAPSPRCA
jgi:VCBS repeat-containing protein